MLFLYCPKSLLCLPCATVTMVKLEVLQKPQVIAWTMGRRRGAIPGWQWEIYLVLASLRWLKGASPVGGGTVKGLGYSNGLPCSSILACGRLAGSLGPGSPPHDSVPAQMVTQAPGGRVEEWACPVLPTLAQPWYMQLAPDWIDTSWGGGVAGTPSLSKA